jgi:hypothetical protein
MKVSTWQEATGRVSWPCVPCSLLSLCRSFMGQLAHLTGMRIMNRRGPAPSGSGMGAVHSDWQASGCPKVTVTVGSSGFHSRFGGGAQSPWSIDERPPAT